MNSVNLIGRLTRDPELRYTSGNQTAVARFSVAIDRGKDRNGNSRGTDFPNIVAFGKTAETCSNYLAKGRQVGIQGHIQTGSYERQDGTKVYTTDVVVDKITFVGNKSDNQQAPSNKPQQGYSQYPQPTEHEYPGFYEYDDEDDENIPF